MCFRSKLPIERKARTAAVSLKSLPHLVKGRIAVRAVVGARSAAGESTPESCHWRLYRATCGRSGSGRGAVDSVLHMSGGDLDDRFAVMKIKEAFKRRLGEQRQKIPAGSATARAIG